MNKGLAYSISELLDKILNPSIVVLAIVESILFLVTLIWMVHIVFSVKKLFTTDTNITPKKITKKGKKIETTNTSITIRSWDDYEKRMNDYQKSLICYSLYSLFVQLFTLLGILGTVAGLYIALRSGDLNGDNLYKGVGFALSSTVYGISCAVIFKFADIVFLSPFVNYIDGKLEAFEKSYKANIDIANHQLSDSNDLQEG